MKKIMVRYIEKIEYSEEYEIEDEDLDDLLNDEVGIWDITSIEDDAWNYGNDTASYLVTDEDDKVIYEI